MKENEAPLCAIDFMHTQQTVYEAIEERGYLAQGLALEETAARQFAKLLEELGEAASYAILPRNIQDRLQRLAEKAKAYFDTPNAWKGAKVFFTSSDLGNELADIGVVLFCLSEIYSKLRVEAGFEPFDLQEAILKKSKADIERGTR